MSLFDPLILAYQYTIACTFHIPSFLVNIGSSLPMFGIICTCHKDIKKSLENGENSCDHGHI
jgi:hypothetical protein